MNDKIISLEIKLEEEIRTQKRLDDLYKQKKAMLIENFV